MILENVSQHNVFPVSSTIITPIDNLKFLLMSVWLSTCSKLSRFNINFFADDIQLYIKIVSCLSWPV